MVWSTTLTDRKYDHVAIGVRNMCLQKPPIFLSEFYFFGENSIDQGDRQGIILMMLRKCFLFPFCLITFLHEEKIEAWEMSASFFGLKKKKRVNVRFICLLRRRERDLFSVMVYFFKRNIFATFDFVWHRRRFTCRFASFMS